MQMIKNGFTVPEFIQLLVASILAGLLIGGLLVYLYIRHRKHRRQGIDDEIQSKANQSGRSPSNGATSVIDIGRETPNIPIQAPPPDEDEDDAMSSAREINLGLETEAEYSNAGRLSPDSSESLSSRRALRSFSSTVTIPSPGGLDHPSPQSRTFLNRNSRHSLHSRLASARSSRQGGVGFHNRSLRISASADLSLSRTTTATASTLPRYDTLSAGPPRYPSLRRSSNSLSLSSSPDQSSPSFIPPLPPHPWWTKQDNSDR